ncbi:MAG: hypothetical protein DYG97_10250 [Ignavibacteria bacterium CHB3]|nr:hypothetical protein [Ignavibacteria bacterium CHB3]
MNTSTQKKKLAQKTNIGLRQKIIKVFNHLPEKEKTIKKVMDLTGCTYFQVYNALNGRVKLDRSPRADKGSSRKNPADESPISNAKPEQFETLEEFLEYQLTVSARDLAKRKYLPDVRIKLLKEITMMKQKLEAQKLEGWLRKPEAILIIRIMKRLNPKLEDSEIKKIYAEEYEKIQRDIN